MALSSDTREDVELGDRGTCRTSDGSARCGIKHHARWLFGLLSTGSHRSNVVAGEAPLQIEDYRAGYPRFSALVGSHESFYICRRFARARARLLLLKQDKVTAAEEELDFIDREEAIGMFLGSSREDQNSRRLNAVAKLDKGLADYDAFLERTHRSLQFDHAPGIAVRNLQRWLDTSGCINREETAYLDDDRDLITLAVPEDNVTSWLETLIEGVIIYLRNSRLQLGNDREGDISRDSKVHVFVTTTLRRTARLLLAPVITAVLLLPVGICYALSNMGARLIVVVMSVMVFVAIVASSTRAKTVELFVAGATYTAVLVVFIASTH